MNGLLRMLRVAAVAAAVALLALTWAQPQAPPAQAAFNDSDGDGAIDLAEEISGSDPDDPASTPENTGVSILTGSPVCSDGIDNDLDGATDGDDTGCVDSDNDLVPDEIEVLVGSDPSNAASFPEDSRVDTVIEYYLFPLSFCGDRIDNDLDGLTDGDDPGCTPINHDGDGFDDATEKLFGSDPADPNSVPEHELANPGSCSDGIDNDLDGLTDSADAACGVPGNDARASATVIASLPFTDGPLTMKNATVEPGEPRPSCSYGGVNATVWYRYTAAADGVLIANTAGSNFETLLTVWRDDGPRLSELACTSGYNGDDSQARAAFAVEAGESYLFQINAFPYGTVLPKLTFNVVAGTPPANDSLTNAVVIGGLPFTGGAVTDAATTQFGEPIPRCLYDRIESTVWYKYTAASDGLLVASTAGSDYAAVLGVWTESKFGLTGVTCAAGYPFPGPEGAVIQPARTAFEAVAGRTYFFQLGGFPFDRSFGNLTFTLEEAVRPANDDFAAAETITSLPFSDTIDTLTASAEFGEPVPTCLFGGPLGATVWYRYTPASDTLIVADATAGDFGASFIVVYRGTALDNLTPVACGNPYLSFYPQTRLGFQARAGETYYFQVGTSGVFFGGGREDAPAGFIPGPQGGPGMLTFNVSELPVPSCPAPEFTFEDPVGDALSFAPPVRSGADAGIILPPSPVEPVSHDITTIQGGSNAQNVCLTVRFAEPIEPPDAQSERALYAYIDFDTDEDRNTGYPSGVDYSCGASALLGVDLSASISGGAGVLVPLYPSFFEGPPPDGGQPFGIALFEDSSFTLILPLDALGGDDAFNFALYVRSNFGPITDCAPNGGFIHSPDLIAAGDINCDGRVNAIDTAIILQMVAGLIPSVPCPFAADVNGSGIIGPIDAQLILQFNAGLLPALPVPSS